MSEGRGRQEGGVRVRRKGVERGEEEGRRREGEGGGGRKI